jgi:drug/metabolite transporter (DMT)-like permease
MRKPVTLGLVAVVMTCFAFNSVATRWLVSRELMDPAAVTVARFASGAAMLAILLGLQRRFSQALPRWHDWPAVVLLGGYALAIGYGYRHITAAAGTFVFYALVVATMTLGGPRPTARATSGAIVALAGVAILAIGRVAGTTLLGVVLLAFTGLAWGGYSLVLRRRATPLATNARAFVGVTLLLPVLAAIEYDRLVFSATGWMVGIVMGAITTSLAYALWARVLPLLTPLEAGTYQLIVPVLTAAAGVLVLDEPFSLRLMAAGSLVIAGMWLSAQSNRQAAQSSSPGSAT